MGKRRQQPKRAKVAAEDAQPGDIYEAEAPLPVEEQRKNINKRYDVRPFVSHQSEGPRAMAAREHSDHCAGSAA